MRATHLFPDLTIWGDCSHKSDHAIPAQQFRNEANPANIGVAILFAKPKPL